MKTNNKLLTIEGLMTSDAWAACSCPTHRCILVRGENYWSCPRGTTCTGLIPDELLIERIATGLPHAMTRRMVDKQWRALLREIKRLAIYEHTPPIYEGVSP